MKSKLAKLKTHVHAMGRKMAESLRDWQQRVQHWLQRQLMKRPNRK